MVIQTFILMALLGGVYLPCIIGLLPDKRRETYDVFFGLIHAYLDAHQLPNTFADGFFMTDFDFAKKKWPTSILAHVYRAADTFNPLMSWVKKMPKPQLNTNSEIFWESYLPGKCNVRCSCKIYRKCPLSLHVGWVFQSMDEDENLRVHAEVCHVPFSADRGVGSLSGYSLKCPQFLTNASCLSVLFLSYFAITSPQPQGPPKQKMSIASATSYGWHLVFSNVSSNWLLEKRHSRIGYICLTFPHCVYLNVLSNCLPETWEEVYLHWLHLFDFSPLCIFKCFFKSLARK